MGKKFAQDKIEIVENMRVEVRTNRSGEELDRRRHGSMVKIEIWGQLERS